jgi:alcohol dehydrogenase class IV
MIVYSKFESAAIPARIISGQGCRQALPELIGSLGLERVLLVTDPNVRNSSDVVGGIERMLGYRVGGIFDRVEAHVPEASVGAAVEFARHLQPDAVLSIGGGSAHDTAKAIAIVLPSGRPIREWATRFEPAHRIHEPASDFVPLPVITVPSTFCAAEVMGGGGFTEASSHEKLIFGHPRVTPTLVVLDGEVAMTTPRSVLLASGMNAVHHCLEALYSKASQPITDAFALHALRGLIHSLPRIAPDVVIPNKSDFQDALNSASLSGLTYANSGLGVGHAICHSLGGRYGLSHAGANSVIVRYSLRFNMETASHKLRPAAEGIGITGGSRDAVAKMPEYIDRLTVRLGVPQSLRDLGLPDGQSEAIAHDVMKDPGIFSNPRPVSFTDVVDLIEQAWYGRSSA